MNLNFPVPPVRQFEEVIFKLLYIYNIYFVVWWDKKII